MEDCIRRGQPPPDSIRNAPELFAGLNLFYTAFLDLHGTRQIGAGLGPIDWLAIDRYCERYGIEGEQYEDMHYFLAQMDSAYLKHEEGKAAAERKKMEQQAKQAAKIKKAPARRRR